MLARLTIDLAPTPNSFDRKSPAVAKRAYTAVKLSFNTNTYGRIYNWGEHTSCRIQTLEKEAIFGKKLAQNQERSG
eukprot:6698282-Ditylum_brightwellii.AAC.1